MQNQKKPIQQKKPMQNFTAEKWADKIALFIDNFGFLSGFFWHWTIALPSPTSHLAMLHSKIILSDPNRRVKVVLIGFSLFWSRCRTWGSCWWKQEDRGSGGCFAACTLAATETKRFVDHSNLILVSNQPMQVMVSSCLAISGYHGHMRSGSLKVRLLMKKDTRTKKEPEGKQKSSFWRCKFCLFWSWLLAFIEPNAAFLSPFKQRIKSWPDHNSKGGWLYKFASHCRKCEQTGANNFVT